MSLDPPRYHEDADLFREALNFSQSETGFTARLLEKDYYCSLLLQDLLAVRIPQWAFKGGTCLSKVHSDFYRMSEDLDFAISVPADVSRSQRSAMTAPMKEHLAKLAKRLSCFTVAEALRGYNNSTQYIAGLCYRSLVTGQDESLKVEFSLREPILEPVEDLPARALLLDPFRRTAAIDPVEVPVMSCRETYAEKLRAALSRRDPAIRDFYDVDYGVQAGRLRTDDRRLIELVRSKLAVFGGEMVDISDAKRAILARQVEAQLKPVLREADFAAFDLGRAFGVVVEVAGALRRG